jgi:hypothetical protein
MQVEICVPLCLRVGERTLDLLPVCMPAPLPSTQLIRWTRMLVTGGKFISFAFWHSRGLSAQNI